LQHISAFFNRRKLATHASMRSVSSEALPERMTRNGSFVETSDEVWRAEADETENYTYAIALQK